VFVNGFGKDNEAILKFVAMEFPETDADFSLSISDFEF